MRAGALPKEPAASRSPASSTAQSGSRELGSLGSILSLFDPIGSAAAEEAHLPKSIPLVIATHIREDPVNREPPEDEEEKQTREQMKELDDPVRGGPRLKPDGAVSVPSPMPALRRLHPDSTYDLDQRAKGSIEYWRKRSTSETVESLQEEKSHLEAKENGTIMQGNTRIKVLEERGFPIDTLPRRLYR